jgi:polysaccharide biosynthesis transport protein
LQPGDGTPSALRLGHDMLNANRRQFASYKDPSLPDPEPDLATRDGLPAADTLEFLTGFLRRQWWIILVMIAVGLGAGAGSLLIIPPNFKAEAELLIDNRKFQLTQQPPIVAEASLETTAAVESQLELLKSENIALSVIKKLNLSEDPEFVDTRPGLITILLGKLMGGGPQPSLSTDDRIARAITVFSKRLSAQRVGTTFAIAIKFEANSADRAAQLANAVADAYIYQQVDSKYQAMHHASEWLESRIQEMQRQTSAAQSAVVEYKARNNIVDAGSGRLIDEQRLTELNSQLTIARAQESEAKARFERLDNIIRAGASDAPINATMSDILKNEIITKLRTQYLELAAREAEFSAKYGADHLAVVNIRNKMRGVQSNILAELKRVREGSRGEYEIAKEHLASTRKQLAEAVEQSQTASEAQVALRALEASAQTDQTLYSELLRRYADSLQLQTSPVSEASVISHARPPRTKDYKKTAVIAVLFLLAGIASGVGIAIVRELADRVFRTGKVVEARLNLPCIAMLPKTPTPRRRQSEKVYDAPAELRTISSDDSSVSREVVDLPFSRFSEGVRSIKYAADLNTPGRSNKVIGFASALPNEGKSTVAMAFGQLVAFSGSRVIVVDCDLRNPTLSHLLAPAVDGGIVELLSGKSSLDQVVWRDPVTGMEFLPARAVDAPLAHSYEILAAESIKRTFEELRTKYDWVVVDLSPLAPVVDARATTQFIDAYVLIVEWGRTKIDVVERALREAPRVHENILGAVLNKVDMKQVDKYDGYPGAYDSYYRKGRAGSKSAGARHAA